MDTQQSPRKVILDPDYRNTFRYPLRELMRCRCQKPITTLNYRMVHLVDGGMQVGHPEDSHMIPVDDP